MCRNTSSLIDSEEWVKPLRPCLGQANYLTVSAFAPSFYPLGLTGFPALWIWGGVKRLRKSSPFTVQGY